MRLLPTRCYSNDAMLSHMVYSSGVMEVWVALGSWLGAQGAIKMSPR